MGTMSPKTIPFQLRLTPRDEIVIENNQHILYMTDFEYRNSKIVRFHFEDFSEITAPSSYPSNAPTNAQTKVEKPSTSKKKKGKKPSPPTKVEKPSPSKKKKNKGKKPSPPKK